MLLKPRLLFPALLLLLMGAVTAVAQELWLQPARFWVAPGTSQHIRVLVGDNFAGARWPGRSSRLTSFVQYAPGQTLDHTAAARLADTLATTVMFVRPGVHLLAFSTTSNYAELEAGKFTEYLRQQGLDYIIALREQRQQQLKPGREMYRRCAKTLVQVGAGGPDTARTYARAVGHALELVPEQNPYAAKPGASLTVLVLAAGQPQRGALVQVRQRLPGQQTAQLFTFRSNQNGRVLFKLSAGATYLVSTVRMEPAADPQVADWQSTWATLTFGTAGISAR
ncbi:DUF4198 domain-containing protein [Hymenobacter persicinus]|uniref:DUF4198 domain-containing protein n=1 Tax=Hymenobacter persicinus TaxID=2025506 RepID=A0A4Q5LBK2_9BACT|nr:DUF4198 domain-containing protein [Hymenobacter persicinus]RYU78470.1 DUF4198 domain-containing protein [Hymenobacter persicinus]